MEDAMTTTQDDSGNQPDHYFAASPHRYQRGRTREQAIANLLAATPQSELRDAIRYNQGLHVRTWHVLAALTVIYPVDPVTKTPQNVEMADRLDYTVISLAGRMNPRPIPE